MTFAELAVDATVNGAVRAPARSTCEKDTRDELAQTGSDLLRGCVHRPRNSMDQGELGFGMETDENCRPSMNVMTENYVPCTNVLEGTESSLKTRYSAERTRRPVSVRTMDKRQAPVKKTSADKRPALNISTSLDHVRRDLSYFAEALPGFESISTAKTYSISAGTFQGATLVSFNWNGDGKYIKLCGSFDNYAMHPLLPTASGGHGIVLQLTPGKRYYYRFLIDGRWKVHREGHIVTIDPSTGLRSNWVDLPIAQEAEPDHVVLTRTNLLERLLALLLGNILKRAKSSTNELIDEAGVRLRGDARQSSRDVLDHVIRARRLFKEYNLDDAIGAYCRAIKLKPKQPETYAEMARVLTERGEHLLAEVNLKAAISLYENEGYEVGCAYKLADAMHYYAVLLDRNGLRSQAEEYYKKAIKVYRREGYNGANMYLVVQNLRRNLKWQMIHADGGHARVPVGTSNDFTRGATENPQSATGPMFEVETDADGIKRSQGLRRGLRERAIGGDAVQFSVPQSDDSPAEDGAIDSRNRASGEATFSRPETQSNEFENLEKLVSRGWGASRLYDDGDLKVFESLSRRRASRFEKHRRDSNIEIVNALMGDLHREATRLKHGDKLEEALSLLALASFARKRYGAWIAPLTIDVNLEIATMLVNMGRHQDAEPFLEDALQVWHRRHDANLELPVGEKWREESEAEILFQLGLVCDRAGRTTAAMAYYRQALELYHEFERYVKIDEINRHLQNLYCQGNDVCDPAN